MAVRNNRRNCHLSKCLPLKIFHKMFSLIKVENDLIEMKHLINCQFLAPPMLSLNFRLINLVMKGQVQKTLRYKLIEFDEKSSTS